MKRSNSQEHDQTDSRSSGVSSPANKKPRLISFEPIRLPIISTVTDLDRHTLAFQNRKLSQRLEQKKRIEHDLRSRIEKLEQRQIRDDSFLCVVNRHWNRFDEDVRILLQRFDKETDVGDDSENSSDNSSSFLIQLSQWEREELDSELAQRVDFSKRHVAKLVDAFERLHKRHVQLTVSLGNSATSNETSAALTKENAALRQENRRLQALAASLHEKNHALSSGHSRMKDQLSATETKLDEYRKEIEEGEFEMEKTRNYAEKLEFEIKEIANKSQHQTNTGAATVANNSTTGQPTTATPSSVPGDSEAPPMTDAERAKLTELTQCVEEQRELAVNRLSQLQELTDRHIKTTQLVEMLKTQLNHTPEQTVLNSAQYCRLQSQFSVLFNESLQMRGQLEEIRCQLTATKVSHLKQIEQMEGEELLAQKQLRAEMVQLEDQLSQVRREYEMLRVEFEQNLAANEQSGPLNKEMRQLLASYKVQNGQFRNEVQRFKQKWKDAVSTIAKVQKELDTEKKSHENCVHISLANDEESHSAHNSVDYYHKALAELERSGELNTSSSNEAGAAGDCAESAAREHLEELAKLDVKDLRRLFQRSERKCRELDMSLASFKHATSDETLRAETYKHMKQENNKLRGYICSIAKKRGKDAMPMPVDEIIKHAKKLEEQVDKLKKEVTGCKQEEETLLNEMEVTGQAFEEMQEQNVRLVQQLKEKDDANFKLMSDRIKTNQQHKLLREEKELLHEQVSALHNQVEAQNLVVRKLEEKESLLQQQLATVEKEIASRQQALELHRRKAIEGMQSLADLKMQVEKLSIQLNEATQSIASKTAGLEQDAFKIARLQEEILAQKKRLERSKKFEKVGGATDEVLLEEIRELKEHLTCPSCKVRRKDGVLTKCLHVFCMDCLKTRYDTRQRKCPKCNAAFGANDFKRIYIG